MSRLKLVALGTLMALAVVACGSQDHSAHEAGGGVPTDHGMAGEVPGAPGVAAEADQTIEVIASDELTFDPAEIELDEGEVVTFVIRNAGETDHEFVLGDEAYQEMHEADMREGHSMMDMQHGVSLAPGATKEITWAFTEAGEVLFGCHQPGHYEGGMVGTITVS